MSSPPLPPPTKKVISLAYCTIWFYTNGEATTLFDDGKMIGAQPHDTPHYHEIAARCGYLNIGQYCQEHEFCHSYLAQILRGGYSPILHDSARDIKPERFAAVSEEALVVTFQRWLRNNERPIISRVNWDLRKSEALALLDGEPTS